MTSALHVCLYCAVIAPWRFLTADGTVFGFLLLWTHSDEQIVILSPDLKGVTQQANLMIFDSIINYGVSETLPSYSFRRVADQYGFSDGRCRYLREQEGRYNAYICASDAVFLSAANINVPPLY